MSHARTITRYAGLAGCLACSLVAVQSLAAPNPSGFHVLSSKATGVKNGQYIEAAVSAAYKHGGTAGNARVYTKAMVPVATSTLRAGALSALGRGVMHPGFQVALLAAGYIISQNDEILAPDMELDPQWSSEQYDMPEGTCFSTNQGCFSNKGIGCSAVSSAYNRTLTGISGNKCMWGATAYYAGSTKYFSTPPSNYIDGVPRRVATSDDLENLDQYIPAQLYDELWNGGPIPEWKDEITVLGAPASYVQPTGDQAVAPEVATKVGSWGENVAAQFDGDPIPNPEESTDSMTADEMQYEEGPAWAEEEIPDFPGTEAEWDVQVIDSLPAFDIGFGPGTCPSPTTVQMPIPAAAPLVLDWAPFCDLASMIRGVVMAVGMILALFIVLRVK